MKPFVMHIFIAFSASIGEKRVGRILTPDALDAIGLNFSVDLHT